jgi:mannonate dehydratase
MKITDAKVIVCSPGRNFVTLKITTEDGIYGLGDATLNGRELAVASYLSDHVIPLLIGRDARRIEDIWQYLYKGAYWRRGPVTMCSIAAVDTALWDIKGKALNAPVYQLLGGASRDAVLVYGHASGQDIEDTIKAVSDYIKLGYKAIRAQSGIPGLQSTYGVGRGKLYYEPAEKDAPLENAWSSELYLNFVPRLFERLRKEFGEDLPLLHDVHHRLTPIEAARLGKSLEPFHLFWLEDSASSASTPRRLWPSVKSSIPSTIASNSSRSNSSITFGPRLCIPAEFRTCERSPAWRSSIKSGPGRTARPI